MTYWRHGCFAGSSSPVPSIESLDILKVYWRKCFHIVLKRNIASYLVESLLVLDFALARNPAINRQLPGEPSETLPGASCRKTISRVATHSRCNPFSLSLYNIASEEQRYEVHKQSFHLKFLVAYKASQLLTVAELVESHQKVISDGASHR